MARTGITVEGGLLGPDTLENLAEATGQRPEDFRLPKGRTINAEATACWVDVRSFWDSFRRMLASVSRDERATVTRDNWVKPLLRILGYRLAYQRAWPEADGRKYPISHRAALEGDDGPPVHIVQYPADGEDNLGHRPPTGRAQMAPHALLQDYLNRSEDLWGLLTNGKHLRLLRDSTYFTRPSYVEFDLEQMLEGERLDEFILLYRLVHRTRLPKATADGPDCLLEQYHQEGIEQGGRIRDGLRNAVENAIVILGNGFLRHPANESLREALRSETLTATAYYKQLLYLIYRFLFLMVGEERGLLGDGRRTANGEQGAEDGEPTSHAPPALRDAFSMARLRKLAEEALPGQGRFEDLYLGLRSLFHMLCDEDLAARLGLPPLNGELFSEATTRDLSGASLSNEHLLSAVREMSFFTSTEKVRRRVNYGALDVEELGSVYESLLDLQPVIGERGMANGEWTASATAATHPSPPAFLFTAGTERKTTGSYYTRPELVQELIRSALVPVIEDRLSMARRVADGEPRTEEERHHVRAVLSGLGGLATRDGARPGGLQAPGDPPGGRALRDGLPDASSGHVDPGEHSRRLGQALPGGVHPVPPTSERAPDRTGDPSAAVRSSGPGPRGRSGASAEGPGDPREAAARAGAEHTGAQPDLTPVWAALPLATRYSLLAARSLLSLRVCDPACGSGHFLLAAARRIGMDLAKVRTGDDAPTPDAVRAATRDAITHCIYGVDKNPLAVDLCRVALWIEGHTGGKPLTFLDHRIRCGDSLVGVFDLSVLDEGIPDKAFDAVTGDDRKVAASVKKRNKQQRKDEVDATLGFFEDEAGGAGDEWRDLGLLPEDTPEQVRAKRRAFEEREREGGRCGGARWPATSGRPPSSAS